MLKKIFSEIYLRKKMQTNVIPENHSSIREKNVISGKADYAYHKKKFT